MPAGIEPLLTIDDAAAILHVSRDWVRKACKDGLIEAVKIGRGSQRFRWLMRREALERFIERQSPEYDRRLHALAKMRVRRLPAVPERF